MKYAIILAGGKGRRLWPVSRKNLPKQFIDFFGCGKTLLQQTYERMQKIMPKENILVVTHTAFEDILREQLPELLNDNLILEPINRNTAPATLMALRSGIIPDDGDVLIVPADQIVMNEDKFKEAIHNATDYIDCYDHVLTMGVKPTRPEPGYGYLQMGELVPATPEHPNPTTHFVKSFTEKPERDFARMFMDSGEFLWNTGIYMAKAKYITQQLTTLMGGDENMDYSMSPNLSIDMAILEKMPDKVVMECSFGWADIGAWHGIYEAFSNADVDNVLVNKKSRLRTENSTHNVISLPDGKLAVISGLSGYIIAEKDNVLLICQKEDSSAMVRKLLGKIETEEGMEDYV
jgi:mannose-1-phosphate guanylyltransferase